MVSHKSIFQWLLWFSVLGITKALAATACLPANGAQSGFKANFFQYNYGDMTTLRQPSFIAGGYAKRQLLGTQNNVNNILIAYGMECQLSNGEVVTPTEPWNFDYSQCKNKRYFSQRHNGTIFGFELTATNFTVELTGYLLAPQTGTYTFTFDHVDDSAILNFGEGIAFDCCNQDAAANGNTQFSINAIKPDYGPTAHMNYSVDLVGNYYYPMRIVYTNRHVFGWLFTTLTLPDGTNIDNDFTGYVYSFVSEPEQPNCTVTSPLPFVTSTSTTPWTGSFTSTYSTQTNVNTDSDGDNAGTVIIDVETPTTPPVLTTEYTGYSGSETSTYSTESTWVTGTDGKTTPETIYHVETPTIPPVLSTSFTGYNGNITSTYSTESTYVTGTDGKTTPETIYHVETPTIPPVLSTSFTGYNGNGTSTFSTESTWVTGTDGKTTPETIYHVETPTIPPVLSTSFTGYNGNITSTYSTESTWVTGTDGKTTPETIYHVETPTIPPVLSTSFTGYNGNGTSTFSTESTWVTGTDGKTTPETIYHVETPTIPPVLSTSFTGYNGNGTSIFSTESTWVTGTDGKTTPETIYHVETPTIPPVLTTEYTGYNGNITSTYSTENTWVTGTDGKTTPETIYHVETPTIPPVLSTTFTGYNGNGTSTFSTESTWVTGTDGKTTPETIYHVETPTAPANVSSPTGVLTTEYSPYPGDSTSTFSTETTWFTGTDGKTTPETIYHVETPTAPANVSSPTGILTTEYSPYSGTASSTFSTETTWFTGSDGKTTPETIYHVETPTAPANVSSPTGVLTTEYSPYPGDSTSTFSTETTWFTGTDGKTTPETIFHVETPTAPANVSSPTGVLTTEYSPYSGTASSTFSTETTWFTGSDGKTTPETIYHVETPTAPANVSSPTGVLSTDYSAYPGDSTSTFSTETTWFTGTDGRTTPETIYHVETPTPTGALSTVFTGYPGDSTSTFSTETTWFTGTDGKTTPETIFHVETPTAPTNVSSPTGVLTTEYSPYPGDSTSTFSTETTWFTGTDGKTTPETIYHVETPTPTGALSTVFTGYPGDSTSTFSTETTWFTGSDGKTTPETIYHVETPTSTGALPSPTGVLSTVFTGYPGDRTSTFSTETTWFTGSDGNTTPETIYHVRTPISTSTIRTPHSWSGGNKTLSTGGKTYYTTTTDIVTTFTTYCPYPTTLTTKSQTFTVTQPTTLTITCTNSGVTQILPVSQTTSSNWQDTANPQATSTNGASHQDASTQQSNGGSPATFTSFATSTEIVTALTTYCPGPTVLTTNGATYTVTEATTLTVTDCPCTRTHTSTITGTIDANTPAATALATGGSSNNGNNNNNGEQDGAQRNSVVVTSTEVVETLTTYCSDYTVLSTNGAVYTVTAPTTLTITDCPCTLTHTSTVAGTADANTPAATALATGGNSNNGNNNNNGGQDGAQRNNVVVTSTEVVEILTTYCPDYTVFSTNGAVYTVTAPTTLTITDCPCTLTHTSTVSSAQPTNGPAATGFTTTKPYPFSAAGFGYTNKTQTLSGLTFNNGSTVLTTIYGGNSSSTATTSSPLSISSSSPYAAQSVSSENENEIIVTQYNTVTANGDGSPITEPTEVSTPTPVASDVTVTEASTAFATMTPAQNAFAKRDSSDNTRYTVTISSNAANSLASRSLIAILGFLFMIL